MTKRIQKLREVGTERAPTGVKNAVEMSMLPSSIQFIFFDPEIHKFENRRVGVVLEHVAEVEKIISKGSGVWGVHKLQDQVFSEQETPPLFFGNQGLLAGSRGRQCRGRSRRRGIRRLRRLALLVEGPDQAFFAGSSSVILRSSLATQVDLGEPEL